MKLRLVFGLIMAVALAALLFAAGGGVTKTSAGPHLGQSVNVVIIGGAALDLSVPCAGSGPAANNMGATAGGCLPVTGPAGELGDFTFTAMTPAAVSAASLAPFDTFVLNVASRAMACNTNTLTPAQQADLVNFVGAGNKGLIYDSECRPQDYSWLPFPFTTANPGALGARGTLTIVEDNTLSTDTTDPQCTAVVPDPHCIDVVNLSNNTDAVGDMNVMTTLDPNWCVDMSGTNAINVTGPVHTYAKFPTGTDDGLMIYNGLDQDFQGFGIGNLNLRKIWVQELQQPFNPSNLPCGITVVGITLSQGTDTNLFGTDHTVTANLTDLLANPQPGILVSFEVTAGPNAGEVSDPNTGECSANSDCTTDAAGNVSWTYTDSASVEACDTIVASFTNAAGVPIDSSELEKCWEKPPESIEKELISGPAEIGIYLPQPTQYVFEIAYTGPIAAKVIDTVPAEFECVSLVPTAGTATCFDTSKGRGNSANRIEWDVPAGSNTLTVTIQTIASPGKGHAKKGGIVFKPTSCGPLPINDGATAFEVNPVTGELVLVEVVDPVTGEITLEPVVIVGPSNSLAVEAVEGAKPCEPVGCAGAVFDICVDGDGIASAGPGAFQIAVGDAVLPAGAGGNPAGLDLIDRGVINGVYDAGDDLMVEDPIGTPTCPTAQRDAVYNNVPGGPQDCVVLDPDGSLANGDFVTCDAGAGCGLSFRDDDGDGRYDEGEDLIVDVNGNGVFD